MPDIIISIILKHYLIFLSGLKNIKHNMLVLYYFILYDNQTLVT